MDVEENKKLVPTCVVTHNSDDGDSGTPKQAEKESEPLLAPGETITPVVEEEVSAGPPKKVTSPGNKFMSTLLQAQKQKQVAGSLKIAVFIKKSIMKNRSSNAASKDNGNMYELKLENGKMTTAAEIKEKMLTNLQIPKNSAHLFALWFISPHLELQLKPQHKPFLVRKKWPELLGKYSGCALPEANADEPVVVFQRNSFISVPEEKQEDDVLVLKILFEEASFNFLNARYRVSLTDALRLGGMLLRVHEGKFDPAVHVPGYLKNRGLRLTDFVPYYASGANKVSQQIYSGGTERRLLHEFQVQSNKLPDNLACYKSFLDVCRNLPFYGSAFFKGTCQQEGVGYKKWKKGTLQVTVGINSRGITFFKGDAEEVLSHLSHTEYYWDYNDDDEIDGDEYFLVEYEDASKQKKQIQIMSKQALLMNAIVHSFTNVTDKSKKENMEGMENDLSKLNVISYIPSNVV